MSLTCTAESARKGDGGECGGTSRIGSRGTEPRIIDAVGLAVRTQKESFFKVLHGARMVDERSPAADPSRRAPGPGTPPERASSTPLRLPLARAQRVELRT